LASSELNGFSIFHFLFPAAESPFFAVFRRRMDVRASMGGVCVRGFFSLLLLKMVGPADVVFCEVANNYRLWPVCEGITCAQFFSFQEPTASVCKMAFAGSREGEGTGRRK
jgi:hypothetical protein